MSVQVSPCWPDSSPVSVGIYWLLRGINRFLDLSTLRQHLAPFYSHTGRPSVDPELMIRMLVIGYCFGIRSERRLCEEVHLNLAYRWFFQLGLEDKIPNHSTFSKNRHGRFRESETFRHVFESVLRRCMTEGLVGVCLLKKDQRRQLVQRFGTSFSTELARSGL